MFGDINYLGVFEPDILNIDRKFINNILENFDTLDMTVKERQDLRLSWSPDHCQSTWLERIQ